MSSDAMAPERRILFGPLAAALLLAGVALLPLLVPGYDFVRQTVSEIGEADSPARWPFSLMLWSVAACVAVFASALRDMARRAGRPGAAAWLTLCMAITVAALGCFPYPHPLHNVFGPTELIGYLAPPVLALTWRGEPRLAPAVRFTLVISAILWISVAANFIVFFRGSEAWAAVKPVYGLVQRSLFVAWGAWATGAGLLLARIKA
jgi:hypothetical membrane protein